MNCIRFLLKDCRLGQRQTHDKQEDYDSSISVTITYLTNRKNEDMTALLPYNLFPLNKTLKNN